MAKQFNHDEALKAARSPEIQAVRDKFHDAARKALARAGVSAVDFLRANPGLSTVGLAKRLGKMHGPVNAIGLAMAIFREAVAIGASREVAKRLLTGEIVERFPQGWSARGSVAPTIKLGSWRGMVKDNVSDERFGEYAASIVKELGSKSPSDGWKPIVENDALIDDLFNRFWPAGDEMSPPPIEAAPPTSDGSWLAWFDHKSALMEKSLGKEHNKVMHSLLPHGMGGALDLYYYPNGLPGTAIATKELTVRPNEGPSNNVYRSYELVMFTKCRLNLDQAKDETTAFGKAHAAIVTILNEVAPYSSGATLNPNATGETATDLSTLGGGCLVFDGFACHSDEAVDRFGLLAVIRIFGSEMDYARRYGGGKLIELLKTHGDYPYSDVNRAPVA